MNNPRYDDPNDPRRDPQNPQNPQKPGETIRPGEREQQQQGGNPPGQQGNPNVRKPGQKDDGRNDQQR